MRVATTLTIIRGNFCFFSSKNIYFVPFHFFRVCCHILISKLPHSAAFSLNDFDKRICLLEHQINIYSKLNECKFNSCSNRNEKLRWNFHVISSFFRFFSFYRCSSCCSNSILLIFFLI